MKSVVGFILFAVVALGLAPPSWAQAPVQAPYSEEPLRFAQAELDSMLAPIALYPDTLLSQLLIAATYPQDVAQAAAWSRANQGLAGDNAVRAVANEPWDPSVKSLVAFPQVLAMLDEHMEWTERLGDAFMSNPTAVSDTIQALRGRADQAGTLRSGEEVVVRRDYGNYVIEPSMPEVVHVPYYDPRVAYGPWWWPHYEPMWWYPWAGYTWTPGYAGFAWGYGVAVGSGFWYTSFDWPRRYIRFGHHRPYYWRGHSHRHGHRWYSDHDHRRNARGWHSSGYSRDRDGRRADWDGRREGRDGRDGRGTGRGDGSNRRTDRGTAPGTAPSAAGIERPQSSRYAPAAPRGTASAPSAGYERPQSSRYAPAAPAPGTAGVPTNGIERRTSPRVYQAAPVQPGGYVQPSQPLSRGAVAPAAPQVQHATQPVQRAPVQRAPVQHAPAPAPVQHAPAPSPVARERSSRSESRSDSDSRPSPNESRSDGGGRSGGGGNSLGRGGGRSQER